MPVVIGLVTLWATLATAAILGDTSTVAAAGGGYLAGCAAMLVVVVTTMRSRR